MIVEILVQEETGIKKDSIRQHIENIVDKKKCSTLNVAVAYATVSGTNQILHAFKKNKLNQSRWVVGLSDMITQPDVLELLLALKGAKVRVADTNQYGTRYHPKVFQFGDHKSGRPEITIIGSANMTASALNDNVETLSLLYAESEKDYSDFRKLWRQLWKIGQPLSSKIMNDYRKKYAAADKIRKDQRRKFKKTTKLKAGQQKVKEVFSSDEAQLDPKLAKVCWIEVGKATLFGRELEFKAELANFFDLVSTGQPAQTFNFELKDGTTTSLRMKYQTKNGMWRLQMNPSIPEVEVGLRPKLPKGGLGRSPHVAIFTKTKAAKTFELRFILDTSKEYAALQTKSEETGTLGQTTARKYGWCN
ncbi:MAG: hypothetical protein COC17_01240 [Hyphomicrobiales bacterium]|nr:MAG: hypothetical protein COC17_01240 [Hyphomicrobiales bacterium]